jgi:hypothetical protein
VSALLDKVPPEILETAGWSSERRRINRETGEIVSTRMLHSGHGLLVAAHPSGALQVERSLPKCYTGQNIEDLRQEDVGPAIAAVDAEIADVLGEGLPSFGSWLPVRVDYCESVHLGDESRVRRQLQRFADVELPHKGLPVRGQSGSVAWTRGAVRLKVYSKYSESKGDEKAAGVLRYEAGVIRARSLRDLRASIEALPAVSRGPLSSRRMLTHELPYSLLVGGAVVPRRVLGIKANLSVLDVLKPEFHAAALGRYLTRLGGYAMSENEISDLVLLKELFAHLGGQRAAALLGWCLLWAASGVRSRQDVLALDMGSLATRYRLLADLRGFREYLRSKGYTVSGEAAEDDGPELLIERFGSMRKYAA